MFPVLSEVAQGRSFCIQWVAPSAARPLLLHCTILSQHTQNKRLSLGWLCASFPSSENVDGLLDDQHLNLGMETNMRKTGFLLPPQKLHTQCSHAGTKSQFRKAMSIAGALGGYI